MISRLLTMLSSISAFFGSALGGMLLTALKKLQIAVQQQDRERILRIVRLIERSANTAIDICLKVRAVLNDGKVDGQEIESLVELIRGRIGEIQNDTDRIRKES